MADKPAKKAPKRLGFGRREKLVIVGAVGLIAVGALHFLVFNPRSNSLQATQAEYLAKQSEYERLQNQSWGRELISRYSQDTANYRSQLYEIVHRESIGLATPDLDSERLGFRERVRTLRAGWYEMNSDPVVTTDLAFVRKQPIGSMENLQQVANGNYLWNLPESLPQNVTLSVVQDNLRQARGKFRLIQRLGNDPVARRDRQTQFNQLLREVGVEPFLIGTDKVTFENWPDYRLPPPLDDVCAVAQMELLLDVLVPPPFGGNAQMLSRARQEPGSLTPEQLEEFVAWYEATNALLHSSREEVGLDEMFDVTYNKDTFFIHNRTLDHIERLVSMAVDVELGSVRMIKIGKDTDIPEPKDPWNLEVEEEEPAPAQQQGGFGTEMMAMEGMDPGALGFGFGEEMMWGGEFGMYAGAQAAAAPVENMIAHVTPIYIRVTGDYSRVWEYILQLSGGPNLFSIEEMTIYGHNSLPEGHIAADLWVNAPIWVIGIPNETTQRAAEFMANQAVESSAAQTADASPAGQPAESVDDPAAPGGG